VRPEDGRFLTVRSSLALEMKPPIKGVAGVA
jgi:hypothetical protein